MAGLSGNINLTAGGIQYALFIVFTLVTYLFIDKTGRRPLLVYGALGMAVCHFVVGGLLLDYGISVPGGVGGNANVVVKVEGSPAYTVIAFCYLLIIVYALTLAPVAWVYAAEVWSLETRAYGMAIAAFGNCQHTSIQNLHRDISLTRIQGFSTSPSASSSLPPSATSRVDCSSSSAASAYLLRSRLSSSIRKLRGSLLRKSRRCSSLADPSRGGRSPGSLTSTLRSRQSSNAGHRWRMRKESNRCYARMGRLRPLMMIRMLRRRRRSDPGVCTTTHVYRETAMKCKIVCINISSLHSVNVHGQQYGMKYPHPQPLYLSSIPSFSAGQPEQLCSVRHELSNSSRLACRVYAVRHKVLQSYSFCQRWRLP